MGRIKVVPRSNPSFWGGAPLVFILACEEAVKLFKRIGTAIADTIGIWVRVAVILAVVFLLAGVFENGFHFEPSWNRVNIPGIIMMLLALGLVIRARPLAQRAPEDRRESAALALKLGGVLLCGAGALIVFLF